VRVDFEIGKCMGIFGIVMRKLGYRSGDATASKKYVSSGRCPRRKLGRGFTGRSGSCSSKYSIVLS